MTETKQDESQFDFVLRQGGILFHRNRRALAKAAGLPFGTVAKIMRREVLNPRSDTVQKMHDAIKKKEEELIASGAAIPTSIPEAKPRRKKAVEPLAVEAQA